MDVTEKILERDWSEEFDKLAKNRMIVSHYKYGWCSQTYPELAQAYKCIRERLDLYEKTGNMEYLVDIRNFAMIEFMHPAIEGAYFKAEDSDKSPGLAGGISYKELMEEKKHRNLWKHLTEQRKIERVIAWVKRLI